MKRKSLRAAVVLAIAASLTMSSCIGSFSLSNKLLSWNRHIDDKFVNELVFVAFWILPVYPVSILSDIVVINAIEFWSGVNPLACGRSVIEGENGRYLVDTDEKGYTVTSEADGSVVRFDYDPDENSWSVCIDEVSYPLMTYIDENHVSLPNADGTRSVVELSQSGLTAYRQTVSDAVMMAAR